MTTVRAAAIQLEAEIGNVDANLTMCETLADAAAAAGADWIVLPEFFSTGIAYRPELRDRAPAVDGEPTRLLAELAVRHGAHVGGSTLVRDADGHVRNAFLLFGPDGELRGRHDKDLPTMWENTIYLAGGDPGRIATGDLTVGVALCWELMRTQTVERLAGRVDLVVGGSGWWSIPSWAPRALTGALESANVRQATGVAPAFAGFVGAPVVHAAHSGVVTCPLPLAPVLYHGHFEGGASVTDADGTILDRRDREQGPGFAIADVPLRRTEPRPAPQRFWLHRRGPVAVGFWAYQNALGRSQYRRAHERREARVGHAEDDRAGVGVA